MNPVDLIKETMPVLYNYPHGIPRNQWRSSYACKHDVEHLVGKYISNDDFKQMVREAEPAFQFLAFPSPNYMVAVKPRFPMEWLRQSCDLKERPQGARNTQWSAYLDALRWRDTHSTARLEHPAVSVGGQGSA
jgi:hypothetical protein